MKSVISETKVQNTYFIDLISPGPGGAIIDSSTSKKEIEVCHFVNVRTDSDDGGVIWKTNGEVVISKCCFELCRSGKKGNNVGGNVIWYDSAGVAFNSCLIFRSTDEAEPGDSSIFSPKSNQCDVDYSNFTRNDGNSQKGNCVLEVGMSAPGNFRYSNVADSKAYRIMCFNTNPNTLALHSNFVNCTTTWFSENLYVLNIKECCIFNNTITKIFLNSVVDCHSDDTRICTEASEFTLFSDEYGNLDICMVRGEFVSLYCGSNTPMIFNTIPIFSLLLVN